MIISASRRTDIPAFYSEWFMNRIREGYCTTVNPFNRNQVTRVSLEPEDTDIIVFWTKNPQPLMKYLDELDERGFKYYFQYTLNAYSKHFEPYLPSLERKIQTFIELSDRIGKEKLIWRYDPIIFTDVTDYKYHYDNFTKLVDKLKNHTNRVVISIVDDYRGSRGRLNELKKIGIKLTDKSLTSKEFKEFINSISSYALEDGLDIFSCAEVVDLSNEGIKHSKCIDNKYIKDVFNIDVVGTKDKGQRKECGCVDSKDIGVYDTCLHRCRYCYANRSDNVVIKNRNEHNVNSPSLIGWYNCKQVEEKKDNIVQTSLFD